MRAVLLLSTLIFSCPAFAYFQMDLMRAHKGANDPGVQWTLADWLTQKNKMSLMDQWLSLHRTVGWFDINTSASQGTYSVTTVDRYGSASVSHDRQVYTLNMNLSLLNIKGEYDHTSDNQEEYGGSAGLRLLGSSSRTTSLVLSYGWRRLQDLTHQERWDNQYAEGELQLYILTWFGLNGQYRYYFPSDSNKGSRLEGHRATAQAFFEFLIFRVYGDYWREPLTISSDGTSQTKTSDGFDGGVKLYF